MPDVSSTGSPRVAVIGGGPMGLEAALYGACAGFDVRLYERGDIACNVRQWGHVGLFTSWRRNRSPLASRLLVEAGCKLAPGGRTSSGFELADYVCQLAALAPLKDRVTTGVEVVGLTRERCLKSDYPFDARRSEFPFRLVLRTATGPTTAAHDAVIDATGVYATPNPVGNGGTPCPGEMQHAKRIDYLLPDITGRDVARFAGKHSLVVGSGHSAAQSLLAICSLMKQHPETRATWVVRRDVPAHGYPYSVIAGDGSTHRNTLHRRANELTKHPRVRFLPRTVVNGIGWNRGFKVDLGVAGAAGGVGVDTIRCDNLLAHTGFRPDNSLWAELQVVEHPVTGGPYGLSEAIVEQNRLRGVGLSTGYAERVPAAGRPRKGPRNWRRPLQDPALLKQPEPNFFVIGIKSFGRDAGFLMHHGFHQIREVWRLITGDLTLDLYGEL